MMGGHRSFTHELHIPDLLGEHVCVEANGFSGCQNALDESGNLKSYCESIVCYEHISELL
jgi:hypothetical protein